MGQYLCTAGGEGEGGYGACVKFSHAFGACVKFSHALGGRGGRDGRDGRDGDAMGKLMMIY